jgi:hypothetical protein
VPLGDEAIGRVRAATQALGYRHIDMISGAGHDAMHIAKVAPAQKAGSLYEKTSYAANELLDVATQNPNTAIIALCQLNRDTEKLTRRPIISDLRDSGKVEEDASLVTGLYYDKLAKLKASPLYEALFQMPKPAVHHCHVTAAAPVDYLIELTYRDYVYYNDRA